MSYGIDLAFKQIPKSEVLDFIEKFKGVILSEEVQEKILEENFMYSPLYPYSRYPKENMRSIRDLTDFWLRAVFTYKFIYLDQFGVLAVVAAEKDYLKPLFDSFIYAQNSCDQDYDYETWEAVPVFKEISDSIRNLTKEEFLELSSKENGLSPDDLEDLDKRMDSKSGEDYYKQSYVYKKIYEQMEDDIWGNGPKVISVSTLYSFEDLYLKRLWLEKKLKEKEVDMDKKDQEWKLLSDEEKTSKLRMFYSADKVKEVLASEKLGDVDKMKNCTTDLFFRAKMKGWKEVKEGFKKEWVLGGYHRHLSRTPCPMGDSVKEGDYRYTIVKDGFSDWNMPRGVEVIEIDKDTLCIFTGIKEEGSNKPLFNNDVIEVEYYGMDSKSSERYLITYNGFTFEMINSLGYKFPFDKKPEKFKIVGNIIDTPELIRIK